MTPSHLAKIKKALLGMSRSPGGIKPGVLEGLAHELGRQREPTYVRDIVPRLPLPLSIPSHAADLRVGTAKNIIKSLLRDVAVWEAYLEGDEDGHQ